MPRRTRKLISIQTLEPNRFRPPIPVIKQVNFDAHTKTKQFAARIRKSSQIRAPTQKNVKFNPAHKNQLNSDPANVVMSISIPTLISSRFQCLDTKTELVSIQTKTKPISTTHTKTKSISMLTLRPSDLWPAYNTNSISTTHTKTKTNDHHT